MRVTNMFSHDFRIPFTVLRTPVRYEMPFVKAGTDFIDPSQYEVSIGVLSQNGYSTPNHPSHG